MGLVDGRPGLLALQEEWVDAAATLQQHEVDAHADAPDSDHLADHVGLGEPVEQVAAVVLERAPVAGQQLVDEGGLLVVVDRDADRRSSVMRGRPWASR